MCDSNELSAGASDDRSGRSIFINGFSPGAIMESDIADYFSVLFDGHVRSAWIDRKFGTHALIEFDDDQWASRAISQRKHYIDDGRVPIFAWKCSKGKYSKRPEKRKCDNPDDDDQSVASESQASRSSGSENDWAAVSKDFSVGQLFDSLRIPQEAALRRESLRVDLEKRILDVGVWPRNSSLVLFGSSANGFGWRNSDIDITLVVDPNAGSRHLTSNGNSHLVNGRDDSQRLTLEEFKQLDAQARLEILASCLREIESNCISNIVQIHGRRCPVLKFMYRADWGVARCELSIDNHHAIRNTSWLKWLSTSYPSLPILYSLFRWWATKSKVIDKIKGASTLNGYTIALMTISFCQQRGLVEWSYEEGQRDSHSTSSPLSGQNVNESTMVGFFNDLINFFGDVHWKQAVITPAVTTARKPVTPIVEFLVSSYFDKEFSFSCVNVQDPFDRTHNTASNVSEESLRRLKIALRHWSTNLRRTDSEGTSKLYSNWSLDNLLDANLEGDDYELDFVCEPSPNTLLLLLSTQNADTIDVGRRWADVAVKAVLEIFSNVLKLRVAKEEGEITSNGEKFYCLAWHATWLMDKRKAALKKLLDEEYEFGVGVSSRFEIEKRISELVSEEGSGSCTKKKKKQKIEPVGEFTLEISVVFQTDFQKLSGRVRGEKHASVLNKFLSGFMDLVFEDAMRKMISASG